MNIPIFFNAAKTFMHKGVECVFSKKANAIVSSDEQKGFLFESFFAVEPINSIRWVDLKIFENQNNSEEEYLPMYRIGNGEHELILWPFLRGSDLVLAVECSSERPDLDDLKPCSGK